MGGSGVYLVTRKLVTLLTQPHWEIIVQTKLVTLDYVSNKSWVAGSNGRSSFNLHFLGKETQLPSQDELNQLWQGTQAAFGYLAVKETSGQTLVITLPPSTGKKLQERFVVRLEEYLRNKK